MLSFMPYKRRSPKVELFPEVAAVRQTNHTDLVLNKNLEKPFAGDWAIPHAYSIDHHYWYVIQHGLFSLRERRLPYESEFVVLYFLLKFYRYPKIVAKQGRGLYPCKIDTIPPSRKIILTHLSIFSPWLLWRQKSCNSLLQGRCMLFIGIQTRKNKTQDAIDVAMFLITASAQNMYSAVLQI